jgi:hypothetical protein
VVNILRGRVVGLSSIGGIAVSGTLEGTVRVEIDGVMTMFGPGSVGTSAVVGIGSAAGIVVVFKILQARPVRVIVVNTIGIAVSLPIWGR